jgi:hypothetical protein
MHVALHSAITAEHLLMYGTFRSQDDSEDLYCNSLFERVRRGTRRIGAKRKIMGRNERHFIWVKERACSKEDCIDPLCHVTLFWGAVRSKKFLLFGDGGTVKEGDTYIMADRHLDEARNKDKLYYRKIEKELGRE